MNDKIAHNAVRAANENQRKSFLWDSTESASKSDACDLKKEKLYDLLAFTEYYRCFWSNYKQLLSACSLHERNFRETHEMSAYLYNKSLDSKYSLLRSVKAVSSLKSIQSLSYY